MKIRIRVDPTDQRIGRGNCSIGYAVPEPLGFIAFRQNGFLHCGHLHGATALPGCDRSADARAGDGT